MTDKFGQYQSAHNWFSRNKEIYYSSRQRAFEILGKKICEIMNVQQFSVWMYSIDRDALVEEMTFYSNDKITKGEVLSRKKYPVYFSYIEKESMIVCNDTQADSLLSEFRDSTLISNCILEAPIYSDGDMIGLACCGVNQKRIWDQLDQEFFVTIADLIGRLFESEKRYDYEKKLRHKIDFLENDLRKKIDDLNDAKLSLEMALESSQAGKWDWDVLSGSATFNKTWFTKIGYEDGELPEDLSSFRKVLHPDDLDHVFKALEEHLQGKTALFECRYRMIMKSGEVQFCFDRGCVIKRSSNGQPIKMTGVNVNITPLVQLEQSLIRSQQQLQAMISSLPTPVAMFDKDFKYLAFSHLWEQTWGKYHAVKIGNLITSLEVNFKKGLFEKFNQALQGQTISKDEDFVVISPETQMWLRWILQPWKHSSAEIGGVIIMCENITQRKEVEMRISQSSKLSALGEMAGGIAHEINNPLSIIKGYIDLLKRQHSRKSLTLDGAIQYIEKMDKMVGRISRIVNGMRRFSRESSMDHKISYSLNKIIDETLDICLERITNNGTALKVTYFTDDVLIECRAVEISQVLLNLINNSFQAIAVFSHPWIEIICKETNEYYQLFISDCGPGIPNNIQHKLFQPFFTTKEIGAGTGLGLSISKGIIEEHQGKLIYQVDAPNTTFLIQFPKLNKEDN